MKSIPRVVIASVSGSSGKTMLSLSLITGLRHLKGLSVAPYKKGPDYIDSAWMSSASASPCFNLDTFMMQQDRVLNSFVCRFSGDIALIEGNRGLYDGFDSEGTHSTAELAKLISSPVVLVLDCSKMTRTAAAVLLGCMKFDPELNIKAVVLNKVSGSRHETSARTAIESCCGLPVVGSIPRLKDIELAERHLGLVTSFETDYLQCRHNILLTIAKEHLDLDRIIDLANNAAALEDCSTVSRPADFIKAQTVRVGVVKDNSFQFYYPENLQELSSRGAEIVDIDSIKTAALPEIDCLYIGGGFPELHAIKLAKNESFRNSVRDAAEQGMPIYAECGGLMFLGRSIDVDGVDHPMAGVLPVSFRMHKKPQAHGYTIAAVSCENPFYPLGTIIRGHEFHYSELLHKGEDDLVFSLSMDLGRGIIKGRDGIVYKNVLATYQHVHAFAAPQWAEGIVRAASEFRKSKRLL
ncbi:MAG: hydrogenobyrinic acid a,c-diamide synthase (glutamine-hydrolyzing) [Nitrospirae bacterium]|nr:hydrogenobyrinic acid a,c-diamide synthase (glutamine-hydrolyzing) [Nitrospirota bacterium]